jgi:hypothetical protein
VIPTRRLERSLELLAYRGAQGPFGQLEHLLSLELEHGQLGHELGDHARDLRRMCRRVAVDLEAAGEAHRLHRADDGEGGCGHGMAYCGERLHEHLEDVAHLVRDTDDVLVSVVVA